MPTVTGYVYFPTDAPRDTERVARAVLPSGVTLLWHHDADRGAYTAAGRYQPVAWADLPLTYTDDPDLHAQFAAVADALWQVCPDLPLFGYRSSTDAAPAIYLLSAGRAVAAFPPLPVGAVPANSMPAKRRGRPPRVRATR